MRKLFSIIAVTAGLFAGPTLAASCGNDAAGFPAWLEEFKAEAAGRGISAKTLANLDGVTYNKQVIKLDRNQKATFKVSFEKFAAARVTKGRISKGKKLLKSQAKLLGSIERSYGVQPEVLMAIWAMETDFGAVTGKLNVLRSLATLAYDCRRSAFFTEELYAALKIIQGGHKSAKDMIGAWAGEIGQTQFLASNYLKYGVDFDGNGRVDLIRSTSDVLASTANLLSSYGWRSGGGYNPGEANFSVLKSWNKSDNYQKAIALMASKIAE
jgi:lytic murein transglycosylase